MSLRIFLLLFGTFGFLTVLPNNVSATSVTIGAPLQVVSPENVYPLVVPWNGISSHIIDAPLTTFVSGGVRFWFNSRSLAQTKYQGSLSNPFQNRLWTRESHLYFSDPYNLLGGPYRKINDSNWTYDGGAPWIVNIYQATDRELLAFIHVEQGALVDGSYTVGKGSIAIAYSNNAGESFQFLGDVVQYQNLRSEYNMQGVPYFIKDGYFYIYYHDLCPGAATAVARAPVTEVMQAARLGKTTEWKKYHSGSWNSSGLGGVCTKVNLEVGIDHTDAMYSTATGKFYILLSRYGSSTLTTWIKLYESSDGINWNFIKNIVEETSPPGGGYQYVSVVDSTGRDNGIVGNSFYVYSAKSIRNASVYRWQVNLIPISSTMAPSPTPVITPRPPTQPPTHIPTPTAPPRTPTPTGNYIPTPTGTPNPGDVSGDGIVNVIDIGIVIDSYNRVPPLNSRADINRDGVVNILDIGVIVDNYTR